MPNYPPHTPPPLYIPHMAQCECVNVYFVATVLYNINEYKKKLKKKKKVYHLYSGAHIINNTESLQVKCNLANADGSFCTHEKKISSDTILILKNVTWS